MHDFFFLMRKCCILVLDEVMSISPSLTENCLAFQLDTNIRGNTYFASQQKHPSTVSSLNVEFALGLFLCLQCSCPLLSEICHCNILIFWPIKVKQTPLACVERETADL